MRRASFGIGLAALIVLIGFEESLAQRRGGGGGGRGGSGGFSGGGRVGGGAVVGPQGGAGVGARSGGTVVGPAGGSRSVGSAGGSYTTNRGTTIEAGGAGRSATGPGGVTAGRGIGGVQVTTPGGKTATKVGTAGGIAGPGGNGVGTKSGVVTGSGPGGSFGSAYHGGVAVGPQGGVATGGRVGVAKGPGGRVAGGTRGAAAVGPYGAAGAKGAIARGPGATRYASTAAIRTTGAAVRTNFGHYNAFTPRWYYKYPGAWFVAGWTAARIWSAPVWGSVSTYCSYPEEPVYYDYGETIVYSGDTVTVNETEVPADQYAQQATELATAGKAAKVEPSAEDFQPLGVFAMVGKGEEKSTNLFQLAINKNGIIRGNYYNALTDTTETVYGSVDKKTQRAAWTVADRKTPVYEAGIANLTKNETTMLVHFSKENAQQFTLVRIEQPEGDQSDVK